MEYFFGPTRIGPTRIGLTRTLSSAPRPGWGPRGVGGPNPEKVEGRKSGSPKGGKPKISLFFCPSSAPFFSLLFSLQGRHAWTTPKKKSENGSGRRKKRAQFGAVQRGAVRRGRSHKHPQAPTHTQTPNVGLKIMFTQVEKLSQVKLGLCGTGLRRIGLSGNWPEYDWAKTKRAPPETGKYT